MMKINMNRGFTLVELMIVVAIVAIIAAVALPSYQSQVQATRRGAAAGCLMEIAQNMERRYTTNFSYDATPQLPPLGCTTENAAQYVFDFATGQPTTSTFTIRAIPQGSQTQDGCGELSLDQKTVKSTSVGTDTVTIKKCWK
jgi:type IV pilus assembly protein PilE